MFCFQYCGLDDQQAGTLPAYVFGMMTVYFLQQVEPPVLPVLHEVSFQGHSKELPGVFKYGAKLKC